MSNSRTLLVLLIAAATVVGIWAVVRLDISGEKGSGLGTAYKYDVDQPDSL
jgi:hypothetical protein